MTMTAAQEKRCSQVLGLPGIVVRRLFEGGGKRPTVPALGWVPVRHLFIDPAYQRPLTPAGIRRVQRIAASWDWRKYQPITITGRDPIKARLAVIDGQHRFEAAKLAKIERLPFYGISPAGAAAEAESFVALNRERTAVSSGDIFRADLAAGREEATTIWRACKAAGITISLATQGHLPPRTVGAVGMLRRILRTAGEAVLTRTLRVMAEANPDALDAFQQHLLRGVADAVAMAGSKVTDEAWVAGLRSADSVSLRALMQLKAKEWAIRQPDAMARLILERCGLESHKRAARASSAEPAPPRQPTGSASRRSAPSKPAAKKTPGVARLSTTGAPSAIDAIRRRDDRRAADQALIDAAVAAGQVRRMPTAAVAPTEGARISKGDRQKLRAYREQQLAAHDESWRGQSAAAKPMGGIRNPEHRAKVVVAATMRKGKQP
jgi:hypothetical protein